MTYGELGFARNETERLVDDEAVGLDWVQGRQESVSAAIATHDLARVDDRLDLVERDPARLGHVERQRRVIARRRAAQIAARDEAARAPDILIRAVGLRIDHNATIVLVYGTKVSARRT